MTIETKLCHTKLLNSPQQIRPTLPPDVWGGGRINNWNNNSQSSRNFVCNVSIDTCAVAVLRPCSRGRFHAFARPICGTSFNWEDSIPSVFTGICRAERRSMLQEC